MGDNEWSEISLKLINFKELLPETSIHYT